MSPQETLAALSRGDPSAARGLLPAARAHAFGAEAFGPAAIVELFTRHPAPLSPAPAETLTRGAFCVFDADAEGREQAFLADLHDGLIARLWRVGEGGLDADAEPALDFAADPFLTQARDPVAFRPEDHADLPPEAASPLGEVAARAARGPDPDTPLAQGRAFVVRALGAGGRGGALLAVSRVGVAPARLAAATFRFGDAGLLHARTVWDEPRDAARLPRLVPAEL